MHFFYQVLLRKLLETVTLSKDMGRYTIFTCSILIMHLLYVKHVVGVLVETQINKILIIQESRAQQKS